MSFALSRTSRCQAYRVDFEPYISNLYAYTAKDGNVFLTLQDRNKFRAWCREVMTQALRHQVPQGDACWDIRSNHEVPLMGVIGCINNYITCNLKSLPSNNMGLNPLPYAMVHPLDADAAPLYGCDVHATTLGAFIDKGMWSSRRRWKVACIAY
jgi:hypothetical protein